MRLTRRGVEASMPLTMEEIVARQDQLRAQHALAVRKVEIERDEARRKSETLQVALVEARRAAETAALERGEQQSRADHSQAKADEARKELETREGFVRQYAAKVREAEDELSKRNDELERLGELYEEATLLVTAKEVEITRKDNEIGQLKQQADKLAKERAAAQQRSAQDQEDIKAAAETLETEHARMRELERRLATAMREVGEKQARLARMDNEIDRLKQAARKGDGGAVKLAEDGQSAAELERRLRAATAEIAEKQSKLSRLENEVKQLRAQALAKGDDDLHVVELQKENLRLATELEELREGSARPGSDDDRLRETMHKLAADVVNMAARLKDEAKPIERALNMPPPEQKGGVQPGIVSLADRIKKTRASSST